MAVIGAGPAGLAVALGLSRLGCTVDILERRPDFSSRGSTLGLAKNGANALRELLTGETETSICDGGEDDVLKPLFDVGIKGDGKLSSLLTYGALHDFLLEKVMAKPDSIVLHMGISITSLDDDEKDEVDEE